MTSNQIEIDSHDLYRLLIGECRYGYSRNNHLMPGGAYDEVKKYFPKMYEADEEHALHTLNQICDECISMELNTYFYDGNDDEFGNRTEALKFIEWCLKELDEKGGAKPYNYNEYLANKAKDDDMRYKVFELVNGEEQVFVGEASTNSLGDVLFGKIKEGTFRKYEKDNNKYIYEILEPFKKTYVVEHI